jgi:hypothetical protein
MREYTDALAAINKKFDDDLLALAAKIRTDLVIPACRKYRCGFVAGNGDFYFYRGESQCGGVGAARTEEFSKPARRAFSAILALLGEKTATGQPLGAYVFDVQCMYRKKETSST